jgi:hypothetical protein
MHQAGTFLEVDHTLDHERVVPLYVSSSAKPERKPVDIHSDERVTFGGPESVMSTSDGMMKSAMLQLRCRLDGCLVRYEDLAAGRIEEIEKYLGFSLSQRALNTNPADGWSASTKKIAPEDLLILDTDWATSRMN